MMCVSSGTTSCDGDTRVQPPGSTASRRTIQRRNRFSRLQRAAAGRPREEVAVAGTGGDGAAVGGADVDGAGAGGERVERRPDVGRGRIVAGDEGALDRSVLAQHRLQHQHQRDEVGAADPAVHDRRQRARVAAGIEVADVARRVRAHHLDDASDRRHHAGDAPERQPRGDERRRARGRRDPRWRPVHELDGIGRRILDVERLVSARRGSRLQNRVIGVPSWHRGHWAAAKFSGAW